MQTTTPATDTTLRVLKQFRVTQNAYSAPGKGSTGCQTEFGARWVPAEILSAAEQSSLESSLDSGSPCGYLWIGLTLSSNNAWMWGTSGDVASYANWEVGQGSPLKGQPYGGIAFSNGKWHDFHGSEIQRTICQRHQAFKEFRVTQNTYSAPGKGSLSGSTGCQTEFGAGWVPAEILSAAEQTDLESWLGIGSLPYLWFGLTLSSGNAWMWGTSGDVAGYANWDAGQGIPPNQDQPYGGVKVCNGKWHDFHGNGESQRTICQSAATNVAAGAAGEQVSAAVGSRAALPALVLLLDIAWNLQ